MQELECAMQRERELKRTFVLAMLLEAVASENLPAGLSERLFLRLSGQYRKSVEGLAESITMRLFQLVVESYSSLQLEVPSRKSLTSLRDELTAGQPNCWAIWSRGLRMEARSRNDRSSKR